MSSEIYIDGAYRTFTEHTANELSGKEGCLVELTSDGKVQLLTTGVALGVVAGKLQGSNDVSIRLLGKGGTVKCVKGASIAIGARVKGSSGGKLATATVGARSIGIVISPTSSGADGDVCEILDLPETYLAPQTAPAFTSTDGTAAAAADLSALKAESEKIGDDVRALRAALVSAGIIL